MRSKLFALAEEELQSEANAEELLPGFYAFIDRIAHPAALQVSHTLRKPANPRKHYMGRLCYFFGLSCDKGPVPHMFKGLLHTPEIPHPIVNDGYQAHAASL